MSAPIVLWLHGNPPTTTAQQTKHTKTGGVYKDTSLTQAREWYLSRLSVACAELSTPLPLKGPVGAILQFRWFKKSAPADGTPKETVPDCDNANKLPMDCVAHVGLIPDDKHVTQLHVEKYWTSDPDQVGLLIMLQPAKQKMLKI